MSNDEYQHQITWGNSQLKEYNLIAPFIEEIIKITIEDDNDNNI